MTNVPYPILKWRDLKEKEWAFRALYALGYTRRDITNAQTGWDRAEPVGGAVFIYPWRDGDIYFTTETAGGKPSIMGRGPLTVVNSGAHLISYLKRHGLCPAKSHV